MRPKGMGDGGRSGRPPGFAIACTAIKDQASVA